MTEEETKAQATQGTATNNEDALIESEEQAEVIDESEIFNIMITTDNHLGYKENDKVRTNDSFYGF